MKKIRYLPNYKGIETKTTDVLANLYILRNKKVIIEFLKDHYNKLIDYFHLKAYEIEK